VRLRENASPCFPSSPNCYGAGGGRGRVHACAHACWVPTSRPMLLPQTHTHRVRAPVSRAALASPGGLKEPAERDASCGIEQGRRKMRQSTPTLSHACEPATGRVCHSLHHASGQERKRREDAGSACATHVEWQQEGGHKPAPHAAALPQTHTHRVRAPVSRAALASPGGLEEPAQRDASCGIEQGRRKMRQSTPTPSHACAPATGRVCHSRHHASGQERERREDAGSAPGRFQLGGVRIRCMRRVPSAHLGGTLGAPRGPARYSEGGSPFPVPCVQLHCTSVPHSLFGGAHRQLQCWRKAAAVVLLH